MHACTVAHTHEHHDIDVPPRTRRALQLVMIPLIVAIAAGLVLLWPGRISTDRLTQSVAPDQIYDATISEVEVGPCIGTDPEITIECTNVEARLLEGPDAGETVGLGEISDVNGPHLEVGDDVVLSYYADAGEGFEYSYADRQRRTPLLVLAVVFALAVIALGRWKGARALAGVAVSLGVLAAFILPALLEGAEPVLVALVGASAIAVIALYLSHGVNVGSTIALIGAFASLALVGLLAMLFVGLTELSGQATEEAIFLQVSGAQVELQGLILAGIVIGTLGVLDDVTVLQVSAVWELHRVNPELGKREVFRSALRIGRDHIASTVNTLVLAYAGAALALLVLFVDTSRPLRDVLTGEVIAVELVRTLVGSIGLVASVPITTALAALIVTRSHVHAEETSEDILRP